MPTSVFNSAADYHLYWSLMIDVSCHLAGVARELTAFDTMRKSAACSGGYAVAGRGYHYAFGNTFLTESMLYRCVCNSHRGFVGTHLRGFFLNFMSDTRRVFSIAGNAFDVHQERGVIRI